MKRFSLVAAAVVAAGLASRTGYAQSLGADLSVSRGVNSGISAPALQNAPITPQTPPQRGPEVVVPGQPGSGGGPALPPVPDAASGAQTNGATADGGAGSASAGPQMRALTPAEYKQALKDLPLFQAAYAGETWKVRSALEKGARVNSADWEYGFTPLMWASVKGRLGTVRYLLKHGANPNMRSREGFRIILAQRSSVTGAQQPALQINGFGVNGTVALAENGAVTALMLAAANGYNLTVKELLANKADANVAASSGETALMFAAYSGHLPTINTLLDYGARLNAADRLESNALVYAIANNQRAAARLLLKKGIRSDISNSVTRQPTADLARALGMRDIAWLIEQNNRKNKSKAVPVKKPAPQASGDGIILLN